MKICSYTDSKNGYNDIVLIDNNRKMLILISLTESKYNGVCLTLSGTDNSILDVPYYEIDYKLYTVEDLIKTRYFTVVINNDSLLLRNDGSITIYNFRENNNIYIEEQPSDEFDFTSIHSIKSKLKFSNLK